MMQRLPHRLEVVLAALLTMLAVLAGCADEPTTPSTDSTQQAPTETGPTDCLPYDRADYPTWLDVDSDCQDTRAEVLIAESQLPVMFTDAGGCRVASGQWLDPYTDAVFTVASDLDIDHLVPLAEAHESGAYAWDSVMKAAYANDLDHPETLIAVSASANRSKGARDPAEWMPPNTSYWAEYAAAWSLVKRTWGLTADAAELATLRDVLGDGAALPTEAPVAACTATSARARGP